MDEASREGLPYFAYGSNMLGARLRARCSSVKTLRVARLAGYRLRFDKRSWKDGTGKCRIEQTGREGDRVWGVLYDLGAGDLEALDRAEGRGSGYEAGRVEVGGGAETETAFAYLADPGFIDPGLASFDWYVELVVAGARENALPESYVAEIQGIRSVPDEDLRRARAARGLLTSFRNTTP
jgi:hypothetical protein